MWIRRGLLAVVVGVVLAGCGQHQTVRGSVAEYLKRVNRIEAALSVPLSSVTQTGAAFAKVQHSGGSLTNLIPAAQEDTLLKAWSQVEVLRRRMAALHTPRPATRLRSLLLQIVDGQAALTRELAQLVVFLPRYDDAVRPLGRATRRLELALAQQTAFGPSGVAAVYATKAAALRQFRASLDAIVRRLRTLRPPAVSRPDYEGQVAALRGMSAAAGKLAAALQGGAPGNVRKLLAQFDRAATSTQTIAAQKARIAAVRAYDGQSSRLARLTQAAEKERLQLANRLS